MKTTIFTILASTVLAFGSTNSSYASVKKDNKDASTILTNVSHISKIEVHGNVELYVSDGNTDHVKVYNQYYAESALVQSQNGVLRISSYKAEKLVVWVTANDLREIAAYDNAEVKSFGSLSKIDLDVKLYNNATAKLNLEAFHASLFVNDNAKATLTGSVTEYSLRYADSARVGKDNFIAVNERRRQIQAAGRRERAGL